MLQTLLAIGLGGAIGSLLRWLLSLGLNGLFPAIPPGTLVVNLIAAYLIGLFMVFFLSHPQLPVYWKLFIMTGCLGGLSTFSTFSLELSLLLQQHRFWMASITIGLHVIGCVLMTFVGFMSGHYLCRIFQ